MRQGLNHIALIIGSMRMGGAERASLNLINEFAERGFRCDLVLVHAEGELISEVHPNVHIVPLGRSRTIFSVFSLRRYLKKIRPQMLIAGQTHVQLIALWARNKKLKKIPIILNEHSTFSSNYPPTSFKNRVIKKLAAYLFPRSEFITAVSSGVKEDLLKMFPGLGKKIKVIYNPVVTDALLRKSVQEINLPWTDDLEVPIVLGVGRLVVDKDFAVLIEAVALAGNSKRVRLVILGDGVEKENLISLAKRLGIDHDVSFQGITSNPFAWMNKANLFVLSSRREGLPMGLIEAMACGCNVVSTDCLSGPKEILENGKFGQLVPIKDPVALSNAILEALMKPKAKEILKEAIKPFQVSLICDEYISLMNVLSDKQE